MFEEWIERISYKPGWWLKVTQSMNADMIDLHVGYFGVSSVRGEPERVISHKREIPVPAGFERFVYEAIVTFQELENHEAREWFRVDGIPWPRFLPHDPKAIMSPLRQTGARYDGIEQEML